jgi:hypothetical protein
LERIEYTTKIAHLAAKLRRCIDFSPAELQQLNALSKSLGIRKLGLEPDSSWNSKRNSKSGLYKKSFQLHRKVRSEREFVAALVQQLG